MQRRSSGVGHSFEQDGKSLELTMGLPRRDYASHCGSFPIVVGVGCLGTVTVSGAPRRQDHELVVAALAELRGVPLGDVALG